MSRTEDCATCKFFEASEAGSGGSGDCRRHAPVAIQHTEIDGIDRMHSSAWTVWPHVGEAQWCGDYEAPPELEEADKVRAWVPKCGECQDGTACPPKHWPPINLSTSTCPKCGELCIPF